MTVTRRSGTAAREKRAVWNGEISHTKSGLTKSKLMKNKRGQIVSKAKHAAGQAQYRYLKREGLLSSRFTRGGGRSRSRSRR